MIKKIDFPRFFDLLSAQDRVEYQELSNQLDNYIHTTRKRNNDSLGGISNIFKSYLNKKDGEDWKRCLVCGFCFLSDNKIAVNTNQLKLFLKAAKSTINSYMIDQLYSVSTDPEDIKELYKSIPYLRSRPPIAKQWTIRKRFSYEPTSEGSSPIPSDHEY